MESNVARFTTHLATNQVVAICVNTDFWLDKIMRHMIRRIYASWCKTSSPWTGKTRDVDG